MGTTKMLLRTGCLAGSALALCVGLLSLSACSGRRTESTTTYDTVSVQRTIQPPPRMVAVSFQDLHEGYATDPSIERVVGTIVNDGDRPVSKLSIKVEGLNDSGQVLASVVTPPLDQNIDPLGGRAQFQADLPRTPGITTYHAVALAR